MCIRDRYTHVLRKLGGEVVEDSTDEKRCTHMIVGTNRVTEKVFCAIARGVWLLEASFVEQSDIAGGFVSEEDHLCSLAAKTSDGTNVCVAHAAREWERKLRGGGSAFQDQKVIACLGSNAVACSYRRLLLQNGATIVPHTGSDLDSVKKIRSHGFSFALFEPSIKGSFAAELLVVAKKAGLKCVKPVYLKDFILSVGADSKLGFERYLVDANCFKSKRSAK
eukprot:TRINITY_DN14556_c0_g1_i1.p1 TRINITY_DN14556_c0_g1~~TRINITY_DN14556_c0_g1_i1.p1  ORF type:complete len:222 (+),score=47.62 TRINITY_DN14556_c0_g1_i1:200-865(+)